MSNIDRILVFRLRIEHRVSAKVAEGSATLSWARHGGFRVGDRVRVGVIGAGGPGSFSDICHIPGLRSHPRAEVAALCGRRREVAQAQADKWAIPHVFTDYREMLRSGAVDAVTIVTPNDTHLEMATAALAAGKAVLCEKPLANSVADADEMTAAAAGKVAMVAFTFRYLHAVRRMREMLADGAIGKPYYVKLWSREFKYVGPQATGNWRQQSQHAGTGVVGDLGSHLFDMVAHVLEPIGEVCSRMVNVPRTLKGDRGSPVEVDVDDLAGVLFTTRGGLPGDLFVSWASPTHDRRQIEIVGDKGALIAHLTRGEDESLKLVRPGKRLAEAERIALPGDAPPDECSALGRMMRSFVDAVLRGSPGEHDADFSAGAAAQRCIEAVVRSSEKRSWQEV